MHNHKHKDVYHVVLQSVLQQTKSISDNNGTIYCTYSDKISRVTRMCLWLILPHGICNI